MTQGEGKVTKWNTDADGFVAHTWIRFSLCVCLCVCVRARLKEERQNSRYMAALYFIPC